jgi:hypothetical protein
LASGSCGKVLVERIGRSVSETRAKKEGQSFMVLAESLSVLREGEPGLAAKPGDRGAVFGGLADGRVLFAEEKTAPC